MDLKLSKDKTAQVSDFVCGHLNCLLLKLKSIFLIENILDSVKFGVVMYGLIVLGRWMNGLTLLTLIWVALFTVPKFYKDNQKVVDDALAPIKAKIAELTGAAQAAVQKKEE